MRINNKNYSLFIYLAYFLLGGTLWNIKVISPTLKQE